MLQSDAQIWIGGLTCATNCKLVLAAGTATKNHYVNEFIQKVLPHSDIKLNGKWRRSSGPGQWAEHTIRIANGKDIPFFFCSTGPSNGGGPTLVSTFRERTNMLRQYLA